MKKCLGIFLRGKRCFTFLSRKLSRYAEFWLLLRPKSNRQEKYEVTWGVPRYQGQRPWKYIPKKLFNVVEEFFGVFVTAELGERFGFNLTNTFAGHGKFLAHFL